MYRGGSNGYNVPYVDYYETDLNYISDLIKDWWIRDDLYDFKEQVSIRSYLEISTIKFSYW